MKKFSSLLLYILSIHIIALLLMTLFRGVFFLSLGTNLPAQDASAANIATAFVRGLWFDNVIACYIVALPLVFTCIVGGINLWRHWCFRAVNAWFGTFYCLVFMAEAGNIPYYNYFGKLLNGSIWNWAEYGGTTLGMIFGEASYWLYIALFFIVSTVFCVALWLLRRRCQQIQFNTADKGNCWQGIVGKVVLSVALMGATFLGIRGRVGYNPIKVSAAYFCANTALNNLGVNPLFNLMYSTIDDHRPENRTLHLMSNEEAVRNVQLWLGRKGVTGISPIARAVQPSEAPTQQNVVVVLMESMSAKLMERFGNNDHLTPNLDSLYRHSLSFANCYSAGNHTNHGLYATLYSFPSIMFRNAMKGTTIPTYSGLPTVLKAAGYSTMFFMTHESQYDNMNAFFRTNGYDEIYSQENYPKERIVNHFGVPDDYLFTYALPVLRRHAQAGKPFFATLLTVSNHPPYVVPEQFQKGGQPEDEIVRYADHCIGSFMKTVEKEPWAKNTIFVFLGDHGKLMGGANAELPESFNHIPLIIHGASIKAEERSQFCGQVDVAPTILGLLRLPYIQNNFGTDLLHDAPRPAAFYSADKTIAARDNSHLFIYSYEQRKDYCYLLKDGKEVLVPYSADFAHLKTYVFSQLQATECLVQKGLTLDHKRSK